MNKIEELIQQYCPNGVEFTEIGKIGDFYGGLTGKSKNDFQDGNAKFVTYMNVFSNIAVKTDIDIFVKIGEKENQNRVEYGDVLFTGSSETPDECGMSSVLTEKITEPLYLNSFCFGFRLHDKELFLPDFLKYLFRDDSIRKQIGQTASGVTRFNISKKRFAKVIIPIPPIAVQQEIAYILDSFTQLEAELEAELEARKKQYEYYRNKLLTPVEENGKWMMNGEEVEWKDIESICNHITSGGTPLSTNPAYYNGSIPWLRTQEVDWVDIYDTGIKISDEGLKNSSAKWIPVNCVIVAMYGATAAKVGINKIPLTTNQACCNLDINPELANYRFVFHWLSKEYLTLKSLGEGSQSNINAKKVRKYPVPIPSLSEQEKIVSILDKFDSLVNDISIGLPAEIEARRKQYEYYRGILLDFKPISN